VFDKDLRAARDRLGAARARIDDARAEQKKAEASLATAERDVQRLVAEIAGLKDQSQKAQEQYLSQLPEALSVRLRTLQETAQKTADERVRVNGELESIRASLAALTTNLENRRAELTRSQKEIAAKKKEIAQTERSVRESHEALEALKLVESQQSESSKAQSEKKRKLDGQRLEVTAKLAQVQANLETRRGMLTQEETRLAQAEVRLQELNEALKQFPEPEPDEKPASVEELKRKVVALEQQLGAMGDVNLRAVEEYDQEKSRSEEFQSESQRLTAEKTELLGLVGEIEKKKREKITEVVGQVGTHFKEIYGELSAGGEGEIALENPEDPLAGGLLIKARPIGKTVSRLEQLSGGEKSLASLAFIFSMQRYDPSPLYVFDEVDMSLDGLNAEFVGRMLRRNAERAQFIVISLRKVTLKFAHHLLGVTMRGDGCSRVVGIDLDDIHDVEGRENARAPEGTAPLEAQ